jgi:hypothetical protein
VTRYEIGADRSWTELGSLSFGNDGVVDAGFGRQWLLDEHTAYLEMEKTKRIVWDPTELVIRGVREDSALEPLRGKLEIEPGLNRRPRLHRGSVLRPFYYVEKTDWLEYAPTSQIAVYDPATGEERSMVDAPCPGLYVGTQDEAGNTYFGLWDALPKLALYGQGPAPCVARVSLDGTLDAQWAPDLTAWAGGRYVMVSLRRERQGTGQRPASRGAGGGLQRGLRCRRPTRRRRALSGLDVRSGEPDGKAGRGPAQHQLGLSRLRHRRSLLRVPALRGPRAHARVRDRHGHRQRDRAL